MICPRTRVLVLAGRIQLWAGKLSMLRVCFASHGKRLVEVSRHCKYAEWPQTARGQPEQLLANWPLQPAPPRKAYVYTSDQPLAHRESTLLLETLFLGNASLTSPWGKLYKLPLPLWPLTFDLHQAELSYSQTVKTLSDPILSLRT